MPWYVPAVLIPSFGLSALFVIRSLTEVQRGADVGKLFALGLWARDEHFTPTGRRYRMWSLVCLGGGVLLVALIYLLTSLGRS